MQTWQPRKWLGLWVGYNLFQVDVDRSGCNGSLNWQYDKPMISYNEMF